MGRSDLRAKIRLEGDSTGATRAVKETEGAFTRLGKGIKKNALAITAVLGSLAGAFRLVKSSAEQAGQSTAFESRLSKQGIAADEFLAKLREVSDNQIANADLILASNRALALGIKADDLPGLLQAAATASVEMGVSVTGAFDRITTGIGRASPLILDDLGIKLDLVQVYKDWATQIGVTVDALSNEQRTAALSAAVLQRNIDIGQDFRETQDSITRSINRSTAAMDNLLNASGLLLGGLSQMAAGGLVAVGVALSLVQEALVKTLRAFVELGRLIPGIDKLWQGWSTTLKRWDDEADISQQKMAALSLELSKGGAATIKVATGMDTARNSASLAAPEFDKVTTSANSVAISTDKASSAQAAFKASLDEALVGSQTLAEGVDTTTAALAGQAEQADQTAAAIVRLTAVEQELAIQQARRDLRAEQRDRGSLQRRRGESTIDTGFFTGNVGTYIVGPDGNLIPT
jgi:hypothetical protein